MEKGSTVLLAVLLSALSTAVSVYALCRPHMESPQEEGPMRFRSDASVPVKLCESGPHSCACDRYGASIGAVAKMYESSIEGWACWVYDPATGRMYKVPQETYAGRPQDERTTRH